MMELLPEIFYIMRLDLNRQLNQLRKSYDSDDEYFASLKPGVVERILELGSNSAELTTLLREESND
ncbi:MAG: hypothetical protein WCJ01_08360 [Ignavibacteria bacterium]